MYSIIGSKVERVPLRQNKINVALVPDMKQLDEVDVIGYGT
jgi:hypothetical protein